LGCLSTHTTARTDACLAHGRTALGDDDRIGCEVRIDRHSGVGLRPGVVSRASRIDACVIRPSAAAASEGE
jgi:hypothetical protein